MDNKARLRLLAKVNWTTTRRTYAYLPLQEENSLDNSVS